MQTSDEFLPVYNKLYDLGLSQKELTSISKTKDFLSSSRLVKKIIKDNCTLKINGAGNYYYGNNDIIINPRYDSDKEKFKALPSEFFQSSDKEIIFNFDIKTNDDLKFCSYFSKIIEKKKLYTRDEALIFNSIKDVKTHILKGLENQAVWDLNREEFPYWAELADDVYDEDKANSVPQINLSTSGKILDVYTSHNTRVAITSLDHGDDAGVFIVEHIHPAYNFIDIGRTYIYRSDQIGYGYYGNRNHNLLPQVYIYDDEVELPTSKHISDYIIKNVCSGTKPILIDSTRVDVEIRRYEKGQMKEKKAQENKVKLEKKLEKQISDVSEGKREFKYNDVTFSQKGLEYEGQVLTSSCFSGGEILQSIVGYRNLKAINFDRAFDSFISKIEGLITHKLGSTGTIGDVDYNITLEYKENSRGVTYCISKVNGHRINRTEIPDVIRRGLCFSNQQDFDDFCHQVSKCSLLYHKYLADGIGINARDEFHHSNIRCKIPLVRRKNKNFIVLDGKDYPVSNTNRLIRLERVTEISEVINILLNPDIVKLNGPDDIRDVIRKGEAAYHDAIERSEKLLEDTEKLFNLEKTEVEIDGRYINGYVIRGQVRTYFLAVSLDYEDSYCRVYSYPDMKYLCVVDKGVDQSINIDKIVQRIYALHNDSLVAEEVSTL